MTYRILVLDDSLERVEWLHKRLPAVLIQHVSTVEEFVDCLGDDNTYDLVIFDHDLGPDEETGFDAAKTFDAPLTTDCLIWSVNPIGAKKIMYLLQDRGYVNVMHVPFGSQALRIYVETLEWWATPKDSTYVEDATKHYLETHPRPTVRIVGVPALKGDDGE